jgi:hypothetical protein
LNRFHVKWWQNSLVKPAHQRGQQPQTHLLTWAGSVPSGGSFVAGGCCYDDRLRRSWRLLLETREEETIVIDYFLDTDV